MNFLISNDNYSIDPNTIILCADSWNDWYTYYTQYHMHYLGTEIGTLKIAKDDNTKSTDLQGCFQKLEDCYFSLGQSEQYYVNMKKKFGQDNSSKILTALRDISFDLTLYEEYKELDITKQSLMRYISAVDISGRFNNLAHGKCKLTPYNIQFTYPYGVNDEQELNLSFDVSPNSIPPTNVHAIIGRNGVGKTRLLKKIVDSWSQKDGRLQDQCIDEILPFEGMIEGGFDKLIFSSFSAFDTVIQSSGSRNYGYLGMKKEQESGDDILYINKTDEDLEEDFKKYLQGCFDEGKYTLWESIIQMLDSDPMFLQYNVAGVVKREREMTLSSENKAVESAGEIFAKLSSGHKIILLTLTGLVYQVEEKTLCLIDEPEIHLHPPLLSAFIGALSALLRTMNGVAILATHSPVVLQEIPKSCVWKLRRINDQVVAERLRMESFGENVGVLTSEVFEHEVRDTGFHHLIEDVAQKYDDYETFSKSFNCELGIEAQIIAQLLFSKKEKNND